MFASTKRLKCPSSNQFVFSILFKGMTLAFAGTYLLVNFAPNITQAISARTIQYYFVGWQFLIYVVRILKIVLSQKLCYLRPLVHAHVGELISFFSSLIAH